MTLLIPSRCLIPRQQVLILTSWPTGGGVRPGGEQVPERRAAALHLRQERGRVGQAGALGHPVRRALQQRALAHPDTAPLVSIEWPL